MCNHDVEVLGSFIRFNGFGFWNVLHTMVEVRFKDADYSFKIFISFSGKHFPVASGTLFQRLRSSGIYIYDNAHAASDHSKERPQNLMY